MCLCLLQKKELRSFFFALADCITGKNVLAIGSKKIYWQMGFPIFALEGRGTLANDQISSTSPMQFRFLYEHY